MSNNAPHNPDTAPVAEMQAALFTLRDSLMNLKMSLLDLAHMTDEAAQQAAQTETEKLLMRLRG